MFNIHENVTADGVVITEGLRVFTNELKVGVVTEDRNEERCCDTNRPSDVGPCRTGQIKTSGGWFSDHSGNSSMNHCPHSEGSTAYSCRHDHWFTVTHDDGTGSMMNGERLATVFEGRSA